MRIGRPDADQDRQRRADGLRSAVTLASRKASAHKTRSMLVRYDIVSERETWETEWGALRAVRRIGAGSRAS